MKRTLVVVLCLAFFTSSVSFADKTTCAHKLRVTAGKLTGGMTALSLIMPPLLFTLPSWYWEAWQYKKDADILKAAEILRRHKTDERKYSHQELKAASKELDQFYEQLLREVPSTPLRQAEVTQHLSDIYLYGVQTGVCKLVSLSDPTLQSMASVLFSENTFDVSRKRIARYKKLKGITTPKLTPQDAEIMLFDFQKDYLD